MARGRFISNEIARDKKINQLSDDTSRLAFTWLITFADAEGRTYGDPALVRSMIFPRRTDVTVEQMERYIQEWHDAGLVVWYEADDDLYIYFPKFEDHQIGLRKDREPDSTIPAPPAIEVPEDEEEVQQSSGELPADIQQSSGENRVNVKLMESNLINGAKAPPEPIDKTTKHPEREELIKHFLIKTGLPAPKTKTQSDIKAAQKLWWSPADEILELGCKDPPTCHGLIDAALARLRDVTVSDMNSIIKTVRAVYAERTNGKPGTSLADLDIPYLGE